ncbi:MAG: hypothetical protein NTW69_10370 [Chloroflexi bacterium]|nr:hypothetical protein [Chloroflexota bacterium]
MKTKIPIWINILQVLILAILTFQTYACYFNPSLLYAGFTVDAVTVKMIYVLAGRNAVMMIISLLALIRQDARFYSFAFLMHSLRELQDMFIVPLTGGGLAIFFVFLIVFVIPEITAYFKLNKIANELSLRNNLTAK